PVCTYTLHPACPRRALPSFPTRRSSDLDDGFPPHTRGSTSARVARASGYFVSPAYAGIDLHVHPNVGIPASFPRIRGDRPTFPRSEEHTSELQSRENLVCRLLLEKKKDR